MVLVRGLEVDRDPGDQPLAQPGQVLHVGSREPERVHRGRDPVVVCRTGVRRRHQVLEEPFTWMPNHVKSLDVSQCGPDKAELSLCLLAELGLTNHRLLKLVPSQSLDLGDELLSHLALHA